MDLKIGGYDRQVLLREDGLEVVKITWPSGTRTKKHNHKKSQGVILVHKGRIFEVRDGEKNYYEAGQMLSEVPAGFAHIVGNDSGEEAVSVHLFRPELEMEYFEDTDADSLALAESAEALV